MSMRALWLENQTLRLRNDAPEPDRADEVRVRVTLAGICNTDIELTRGYYPFAGIPGHEFTGVVDRGPSHLEGNRVVGEINAVCHQCQACRNGRPTHCERRTVLGIARRDGAFAEFLSLPAGNLHVVPDHISDEEAVFTEPLAAALEIQEQIDISASDRVLVAGDGKLGQLVARSLALTGCRVAVAGRHPRKLDLLAQHGISTLRPDEVEGRAFDIAVECTGSAGGFDLARRALRPRGTLVLKSTYAGSLTLNASPLVVDEITIVGSRCGPFGRALELLGRGSIDPRPLIDAEYPLARALEAFEHAQRPGTLKVLVRP